MSELLKVSLEQMGDLADKIINKIEPGLIIGLVGDLGAGKTTFVQILANKLGVKERVNSPTFNLQKIYNFEPAIKGLSCLLHVDAYRLNSTLELEDIGFFETLKNGKTVAVVEWVDQLSGLDNNGKYLLIEFVGINDPNFREIKISDN